MSMGKGLNLGILGTNRVTHVSQSELSECGLACLAMIVGFHGLHVDMTALRQRFLLSSRGASLRSLMKIADRLDLTTRAVKVELENLGSLNLPAILHWNMNHFVVIEKVVRQRVLVHDPAGEPKWLRLSEVSSHFTGIALELSPNAFFEAADVRLKLRLSNLWAQVRGLKRAVAQTIILSFLIEIFTLASPYYLQISIDTALPQLNMGLLGVLAIGFGLFAVFNGVAIFMRSSVLLAVGASFGYGLTSNVARKLFRLPVDWFARRQVGDVLSRFQSVIPIRKMLAEDAPATFVDGALAVFTFALMCVYSLTLSLITMASLCLYAAVQAASFGARRRAQEEVIVASGREQSVLIETLRGIRALRLAGREVLRHAVWQSRMTDAVNGNIRYQRLLNWQGAIQTTLLASENVISIWLAIRMVIGGGFSVGMVFAFLAYRTQFLTAGTSLVTKAADFKMLGLHLERIADIALAPEDNVFRINGGPRLDLQGKIELRDVFYQYGSDEPFVLRGVSLVISPGESIAITGPSGGGKSTLLQILLGLTQPTRGEILVDGMTIQNFGYQSYHEQISAVLQDDTLFGGTLAENISLFDEAPNRERIRECAKMAAIECDIDAMPMRYETLVGEFGTALSGGQRQRVLLARALYRRPRVLVLDEGTSHLDEARENEVNNAISEMGITRINVAHRKETIASADRVYLLAQGKMNEVTRVSPESATL